MTDSELSYGDEVVVEWGLAQVHGHVHEVYGPPARKHVVVRLTPELSGGAVSEPTTVSVPLEAIRRVAPAA